jgi:hypothetical protein
MSYQKITFANGTTPAINDDNLNHIQTQYDEAVSYTNSVVAGSAAMITSATTMTLPSTGKVFVVTGTTTITKIAGGWDGREVILLFAGELTVVKNFYHILQSDFNSTENAALHLVCYGSTWYEVSRSAN